jgi:predicted permease
MREMLRRVWFLIRRRQFEADLAEEMDFHREMKHRELEKAGSDAMEAANAARRAFGSAALATDRARDVWLWPWLQSVSQDFRFAVRLLAKDRLFTIFAVMALGLGIGVNNTFFTVVNAVCFRGLPIDAPDRVMYVSSRDAGPRAMGVSFLDFEAMRSETRAFSALAAFAAAPFVVGDEGRAPDRVPGAYISASGFRLLREEPVLGHTFRDDDDRPGASPVVILGNGLWKNRYGGDPTAIGRTIRVNGMSATVIGVMRQGFRFPNNADLWQPLALAPNIGAPRRDMRALAVFGRLVDRATVPQARAELNSVSQRLALAYPATNSGISATVVPINDQYNSRITDPVWIAFTIAGILVLLIACANVANLLLMRAVHRAREIAIRASLGATRRRVVRQLLVESLVLAALGGLAGLGLSFVGTRLLSTTLTENAPYWIHFTMDRRILVVLTAVCLGTVLVFGLVPALHVSKIDTNKVLKDGGRGADGSGARRWTTAFLSAEFALTMVLLAAVVTGFRNFNAQQRADTVIDPSHVLTMWVSLPAQKYPAAEQRMAFYRQLEERLDGVGPVSSLAFASALPFGGAVPRALAIDGRPPIKGQPQLTVWTVTVGGQYFAAFGVPLRRGRGFAESDGTPGRENVVVNEMFATVYFPSRDPIGGRIQLINENAPLASASWRTIVGVSASVRQRTGLNPDPIVYLPLRQDPPASAALVVRTASEPGALASLVREELRAIDPDLPLYRVKTMDEVMSESMLNGRVSQALVTTITGIALALSALGLYAVTTHAVAHRTFEIGVRMALGAQRRQVVTLVLRRAVAQLLIGLCVGIACTALWERLFGDPTSPYPMTDPLVLSAVIVLAVLVALAACFWPARRAAQLDPVVALRVE